MRARALLARPSSRSSSSPCLWERSAEKFSSNSPLAPPPTVYSSRCLIASPVECLGFVRPDATRRGVARRRAPRACTRDLRRAAEAHGRGAQIARPRSDRASKASSRAISREKARRVVGRDVLALAGDRAGVARRWHPRPRVVHLGRPPGRGRPHPGVQEPELAARGLVRDSVDSDRSRRASIDRAAPRSIPSSLDDDDDRR